MLVSLKEVIRCSGLSPEKFVADWKVLQRGISTWLHSRDLEAVHLEVFNPNTDALIGHWDFDIYLAGREMAACGSTRTTSATTSQGRSVGHRHAITASCSTTKPGRPNAEGLK